MEKFISNKKTLTAAIATMMLLATACSAQPANQAKPAGDTKAKTDTQATANQDAKTIKIGFSAPASDPRNDGAMKFKEIVEKETKGAIKVEIHPNAELGNDPDLIEGVKLGTIEMTISSAGNFAGYDPKLGISALPFLFKDYDTAHRFLETPQVKKIEEGLLKSNMRVLSNFENGFRDVTNSKKAIEKPEDLKGLRIRTPDNPYLVETMKALGASPNPLGFSELYVSLQQKVFDGQENPIPIIYNSKFYEVQKYLSITNHSYDAMPFVINEPFFQSLTKEQQDIIQKAAIEAQNVNRQIVEKQATDYLDQLQQKGMVISKPDLAPFKEATKDVAQKFASSFTPEELQFTTTFK